MTTYFGKINNNQTTNNIYQNCRKKENFCQNKKKNKKNQFNQGISRSIVLKKFVNLINIDN